ncbi:MAG: radical SAM protein [Ignavibacteriales bacterium]|nr:radical SAM protein [Ignavibacteriales bacterium]
MNITSTNISQFDYVIDPKYKVIKDDDNFYLSNDVSRQQINFSAAFIISSLIEHKFLDSVLRKMTSRFNITLEQVFEDAQSLLKNLYRQNILSIYKSGKKVNIRSWQKYAIENVQVILTRKCNLRCRHCFIDDYGGHNEMKLEHFDSLFFQLVERGAEFVHFSGGELFMRPDWLQIFQLASKAKLAFGLNTNGTLLDEGIIDLLKVYSPRDLSISVYGHTAQLHEQITRKRGTFTKTTNVIRLLSNAGLDVFVKTMVTKYNKDYLKEIEEFTYSLGAKSIIFDPFIIKKMDGDTFPLDLRISNLDLVNFDKSDFRLKLKYSDKNPESLVCNAGIDRVAIESDGTVYPCSAFRLPIGNIRYESLEQILTESETLKEFLNFKFKDLPIDCISCKAINYCQICPGRSYAEYGDYKARCAFTCLRTKMNMYKKEMHV